MWATIDAIITIALDLFIIGTFVATIRGMYIKGSVTLTCVLGILYGGGIMILTVSVSGPRVTFIVGAILFVACTVMLIRHKT